MRAVILILMMAAACPIGAAATALPVSPEGFWFPKDRKAVVEIARCGGAFCGRIVWIDESRPPPGASGPPVDLHNPDPQLRSRRLCGLEILRGFRPDESGSWRDGIVYNPQDGQEWKAQITADGPDALQLRGYVLIPLLGVSQQWTRAPDDFTARCAVN